MLAELDTLLPILLTDPVNRHHPLNRGRVAWWLAVPGLDGGRQWFDLMGQAHGTLSNGPTWRSSARPGSWGSLKFDGTDDRIIVSGVSFTSGPITISTWLRCPWQTQRYRNLFDWGGGGSAGIRLLTTGGTANGWLTRSIAVVGNGYSPGNSPRASAAYGAALADNSWHHVCVTMTSGGSAIYIDGVALSLDLNASGNAVGTLAAQQISLGSNPADGDYSDGEQDDVSYWSRALSPAEVQASYDLSRRGYPGVLNRLGGRSMVVMVLPPPASGASALLTAM